MIPTFARVLPARIPAGRVLRWGVWLAACLLAPVAAALSLAWDPSPGVGVAGYRLHVGLASGVYDYSIDVGASTTHPLPALSAGRTHYFAVTAYDSTGAQGAYSNEVALGADAGDALPLSAGFAALPIVGIVPHTVRFSPSVSGALRWYWWDFGDGNEFMSESVNPLPDVAHTYERPGTYSVTFVAGGPGGVRTSHQTALIKVASAVGNDGCPCTAWGSAVPRVDDDRSDAPINVGMRFTTTRDGYVTAIRFYKSLANVGQHVGDLWTESGEHLGSVAFTNESASGWQVAAFATPVRLAAHTTYVVSYHAPFGHVAKDDGALLKGVYNGPLHVPASRASASNGVHAQGPPSTFPGDSDKQTNYWVDVVFVPVD